MQDSVGVYRMGITGEEVSIGHLCTPKQAWEKGKVECEHQPRTRLLRALEVEMYRAAPRQPASHQNLTPGLMMAMALVSWIWIQISVPLPQSYPAKFPGLSEVASASVY